MIQLAEKHNLQHISEGDGDQRHITIIKNIPKKESIQNHEEDDDDDDDEVEEIHGPFRSFSVLEEGKKGSVQIGDKTATSSKTTSDQNLVSPDRQEGEVRKTFFFIFWFFFHHSMISLLDRITTCSSRSS